MGKFTLRRYATREKPEIPMERECGRKICLCRESNPVVQTVASGYVGS